MRERDKIWNGQTRRNKNKPRMNQQIFDEISLLTWNVEIIVESDELFFTELNPLLRLLQVCDELDQID